jgi:O-antigen ligase
MGLEHLPFGAGLNSFVATSPERYGVSFSAYNSLWEAMAESGLLGLIGVLMLVAVPLIASLRSARESVPPGAIGGAMAAGFIVLCWYESVLLSEFSALVFGICLAGAASVGREPAAEVNSPAVQASDAASLEWTAQRGAWLQHPAPQ